MGNMSKFRRCICLFASVVFVGMTLGGCALFKTDVKYDNSQVVATVGSNIQITKKELLDSFNNYGYQYVTQFSYTRKKALDSTLDMLVDREVAVRESVRLFGELSIDEKNKARNTAYEYMTNSFKSVEKTIRAQRGRSDSEVSEKKDEEKEKGVTYTTFEPILKKTINGSQWTVNPDGTHTTTTGYVLNVDKYTEFTGVEPTFKDGEDDKGVWHSANWYFIESLKMGRGAQDPAEVAIATETFNRMVRYLSNREQGVGQYFVGKAHDGKWKFKNVKYNTEAQKRAVIERDIERVRIEEEKNILQKRLQECFNWGIRNPESGEAIQTVSQDVFNEETRKWEKVDVQMNSYNYLTELLRTNRVDEFKTIVGENNQTYADNLARRAIENFRNKLRVARLRYDAGYDKDSGYGAKILENLSTTVFAPYSIARQYFTVSHILVGFSEEQKAEIESINTRFKQGAINETDRDYMLREVRNSTEGVEYDADGNAVADVNVHDIYENVKAAVEKFPLGVAGNLEKRQRAFRDMIYTYNTDPGMQNPEFEYVIGIDKRATQEERDKDYKEGETDPMSKMVAAFTRASRELYNWDYTNNNSLSLNKGKIWESQKDEEDIKTGERPGSGLVWTDFGAHIIMYTRDVTDFVFYNTYELIDAELEHYLNSTLTSYGDKTYMDLSLDTVTQSDYNAWEKALLGNYKGDKKKGTITIYRWRYKDLTKE